MKKYVNLYTEANPNPNSLKFVLNFMLVPEGASFDFPDAQSATGCPLAQELFEYAYVKRVFVMSNFITVTKTEEVAWEDVIVSLKKHIKEYFEDNKPLFTQQKIEQLQAGEAGGEDDPEVVQKIKHLLDEYVRPAVESDGGAINFHSYNEGVVTVQLQGSCSGCPSSTLTLKAGIENLLKRMLPGEVTEVVAEGV
jgi:NFU1 iron-sulfur cluster scaffold homolog, mitochondrial